MSRRAATRIFTRAGLWTHGCSVTRGRWVRDLCRVSGVARERRIAIGDDERPSARRGAKNRFKYVRARMSAGSSSDFVHFTLRGSEAIQRTKAGGSARPRGRTAYRRILPRLTEFAFFISQR